MQANKRWFNVAKFLPYSRAILFVRVDLGLDLSDVEFVSRDEIKNLKY